jgi:hypothetical protein
MDKRAQLELHLCDAAVNPDSAAAADFFARESKSVDRIKEVRDLARTMRDQGVLGKKMTQAQYLIFIRYLKASAVKNEVVGTSCDIEQLASNKLLHRVLISAGLSRVYEHLSEGPFAIMSSWKSWFSDEENSKRDNRLRVRLHNLGLGFLPAKGVWKNLEGELDSEASLFIVGIDRQTALGLAKHFQQAELIWGDSGRYDLLDANTGISKKGGPVSDDFHHLDPGEVPPSGKTEVKKKPFTLSGRPFDGVINAEECYGGWAVGNRQRWWPGMSKTAKWDRGGRPYFFWNKLDHKSTWPRFGFDLETKSEMTIDESKHYLDLGVFLPLGPLCMGEIWGK